MTATFDFLVAGEDEASLAAAAAAAQAGARSALLRRPKRPTRAPSASFPSVPNFVWRRFDLQEYGLTLEPASARVTLAPGGAVATYARARETERALAEAGSADYLMWAAFANDMTAFNEAQIYNEALGDASPNRAEAFAALFRDSRSLSALGQLAGPAAAMLDDYFSDETMKIHVGAQALARAGLGGREAGSALALPEFLAEDAWPARIAAGPSLLSVFEKVCDKAGVEKLEGRILEITDEGGKYRNVVLTGDQKIKTQFIFFASPEAAASAGARSALSPLGAGRHATAVMRLALKNGVKPPAGDEKAVFQIADDFAELQAARDAAAAGRLPERPPVEFEFAANGDIIARTAYCPAVFREEDGERGWTGQDRQAIAARMKERLASRIDGLSGKIVKTEVGIIGAGDPENDVRLSDDENIIIQTSRCNAIAAAVRLVDRALQNV